MLTKKSGRHLNIILFDASSSFKFCIHVLTFAVFERSIALLWKGCRFPSMAT